MSIKMTGHILILVIGCLVFVHGDKFKSQPLPSYITACKRTDPNLAECARKSANAAIPHLLKGDKKYRTPDLAPLKIPQMELKSGNNLKIVLKDVSVNGLMSTEVTSLKIDVEKRHIELVASEKLLNVDSMYEISGTILVLPISGNGPANLTFADSVVTFSFDYELEKKSDGKEYIKVVNPKTKMDIPKAFFHFENLFNGNKELGDQMNKFLNENFKEVLQDIGYPVVSELIQVVVARVFQSFTKVVPYEVILP